MHTKTTENDQFIFFHGRAHHDIATQNVSWFYHASMFSYELNKELHILTFSKKG